MYKVAGAFLLLFVGPTLADEVSFIATPAEQALIDLMTQYNKAQDAYFDDGVSFPSAKDKEQALKDGRLSNPDATYLPKLLDFEKQYEGQNVGLLALYHVYAGSHNVIFDPAGAPRKTARRKAAPRLAKYAQSELMPNLARIAVSPYHQPEVDKALASIAADNSTPSLTCVALRYEMAQSATDAYERMQSVQQRMYELRNEAKPINADELYWKEIFQAFLPKEAVERRYAAAMIELEEIAARHPTQRVPGFESVDEKGFVFRSVDDRSQATFSDKAAALLFRERHLSVGSPAPGLSVSLLDGSQWRMADHLGKVVLVQFSFTGCGPCEEMYSDLADLKDKFGPQVEILTIMRDATATSAKEKVASGKLTWSVAHDGKPGSVTSEWSVQKFPTVYVIDRSGRIAHQEIASLHETASRLSKDKATPSQNRLSRSSR